MSEFYCTFLLLTCSKTAWVLYCMSLRKCANAAATAFSSSDIPTLFLPFLVALSLAASPKYPDSCSRLRLKQALAAIQTEPKLPLWKYSEYGIKLGKVGGAGKA